MVNESVKFPAIWQQVDLPRNLRDHKKSLWGFLLLIVIGAGLRFSDGTVLLAISRGLPPSDPSLKDLGQWLWDSPLKVGLLRVLPANAVVIGLAFAILGILPLAGLISKNQRMLWLTVATVFLTPAIKVSIQNLGVGDGLTMFLVLCISVTTNLYLTAAATLLVALWHPQQSFFIGVSLFVGQFCYYGKLERQQALTIVGALAMGAAAYTIYKFSLPFKFVGRSEYMAQHGQDTLIRNLYFSPIAFAPLALWFCLLAPKPKRRSWLLVVWTCVLGVIAILTSDVTRVITITSLPIVLAGANKIFEERSFLSTPRALTVAIIIAIVPPLNWSGLDYLVWPSLIRDLCKWHFYCAASH